MGRQTDITARRAGHRRIVLFSLERKLGTQTQQQEKTEKTKQLSLNSGKIGTENVNTKQELKT